ncbi:hypothetical protein I1E95_09320 [Synechococcus sp. CBW1107]|uniref:hypothetical protein n=1 Tax=Synechococcus sp. CBW1107 TaxID=2789857 RepID=UPI0018CEFF85|nr:hypothetical protein [Synechococcus sp. CBW1107]QPN55429.1 hypothetical protein I1E95_09320 [Synechococcus sp. CBW1107]CAK6689661.1 hypothetical protein BBFGKLBO_00663 [Synechococcus sp. CBW1107]
MDRFHRPSGRRRRGSPRRPGGPPVGRPAISWGVVAVITLILAAASIVIVHQQQAGHHPLKMRRELRKF